MNSGPNLNRIIASVVVCACCAWQFADGAELPKRKPGQWQITMTSDNSKVPPGIEDVCLDEATDALLYKFAIGVSQQLCSKYDWKNLGGGKASVDATCNFGTMRMTIRGDIAFTGNTAYREDIKTHFEPPLHGRSDVTSVHDAKWTGACAADMKPGDIVSRPSPTMPMSVRMNLNEMMKRDGQ
jgi:hypothetical protein